MKNLSPDLARILISEDEIKARVQVLADEICRTYEKDDNPVIIGILKGAFIFLADLTRCLEIPHTVDFMALTSYGKTTTIGEVRILMDLREPIEGRHVLIVEDIIDSGHTLSYLHRVLRGRSPASLKTCVLVKKETNGVNIAIDFLGFTVPDVWVVGYGLDFADKYRTLPYIAELKQDHPTE